LYLLEGQIVSQIRAEFSCQRVGECFNFLAPGTPLSHLIRRRIRKGFRPPLGNRNPSPRAEFLENAKYVAELRVWEDHPRHLPEGRLSGKSKSDGSGGLGAVPVAYPWQRWRIDHPKGDPSANRKISPWFTIRLICGLTITWLYRARDALTNWSARFRRILTPLNREAFCSIASSAFVVNGEVQVLKFVGRPAACGDHPPVEVAWMGGNL